MSTQQQGRTLNRAALALAFLVLLGLVAMCLGAYLEGGFGWLLIVAGGIGVASGLRLDLL